MSDWHTNTNDLRKELTALLNRFSRENFSNTPDFLLANFLMECLQAFERASMQREKWYGKALTPAGIAEVNPGLDPIPPELIHD